MGHDECSRRDFLTRFAKLSSAALLLGLGGCGMNNNPTPGAAYGPPPDVTPYVRTISWYDPSTGTETVLNGTIRENVPLNANFRITFTAFMDLSVLPTVNFAVANGVDVAHTEVWGNGAELNVVPTSDLSSNTLYILSLTDAVSSYYGRHLVLNDKSTVVFKTAV